MSNRTRRIEAVIFDLDDTLLDWSGREESWQEVTRPLLENVYHHLVESGHALNDPEAFYELVHQHVEGVWEEAKKDWSGAYFGDALLLACEDAGLDTTRLDLDELMRVYNWQPMPGVDPYEDTFCVLDALQDHGYRIGLITNSFYPMWMRDVELRHYNLLDYFDARITSGDSGYMKPHPAIYQRILDLLDVPAARAVFVGDRPENDIAGANEAGLISILIDPPHLDRELQGIVPDFTITRLSELLPILEQLEEEGKTDG